MELTPDSTVFWQGPGFSINATLVSSWIVMAILVIGSWLVTRQLRSEGKIPFWQSALEVIVLTIRDSIAEVNQRDAVRFIPLVGTLFLFISLSNLLELVPNFHPPTGSLSTTAALAVCVFFAVPVVGISTVGLGGYLKEYFQPSPIMFPFHVIGEISRTIALAIRLFGNIMSGSLLLAVLLTIAPLFFPILVQRLARLLGQIQAYIWAILTTVYLSSAAQAHEEKQTQEKGPQHG